MGVHIRVANVKLDADGRVAPDEVARFLTELEAVRESLVSCFSTMLVSMALLLTILVVLFLASPDHGEAHEPDASISMAAPPSVWDADAVGWLTGGNNELAVRRGFHLAESTLLAVCVAGCLAGLFLAQCQLVIVSALPGNLAMIEYLLHGGLKPIFTVYFCVDVPFFLTPVAMPFIAARYSAVAFLAALAIFVFCWAFWCNFMGAETQPLMLQNRLLQRWAKSAVARTQAEKS